MRAEPRGTYPEDWRKIATRVKQEAGYRCVRCRHPFGADNMALACTPECDRQRCRAPLIRNRGGSHSFTVHHLDGDKGNTAWWNLLACCNSCHLSVQSRVILERGYLFPHSEWFQVYVAGYYASTLGLHPRRDLVEANLAEYLALGQPWLAER